MQLASVTSFEAMLVNSMPLRTPRMHSSQLSTISLKKTNNSPTKTSN